MLNKKNFTAILLVLIILILFSASSCGGNIQNISTEIEIDGGTGILADNNVVDFYFYYPENFTLDKNAAMISVYIIDQEVATMDKVDLESNENYSVLTNPNLSATVFALPPDGRYQTVEKYWENYAMPFYQTTFQNIQVDTAEDLTVGDLAAKKYTYTADLAGMTYKYAGVIFFRDRQVYTLTYTSTPQKFDKYINVLDTAVETFTFK